MKTSAKGIDFIKKWEGFRSAPYLDVAGVPTIGFGSTFYESGRKVTMRDRHITEEEATKLKANIVKKFEDWVNKLVTEKLEQHQFDALVSFCYNVGPGALKRSTLLRKINADPKDPTVANEFTKWTKSGGRRYRGLARRRIQEAYLFEFGYCVEIIKLKDDKYI